MRAQTVRWKIARRHLNQRRTHRLRWALLVVFAILLLTSGATVAGGMYFASQLPSTDRFHLRTAFQDARFYDVRGNLLYNMADLSKNRGKRVVEPLQALNDYRSPCRGGVNRIPLLLQDATIATEDASFYNNPGFDPFSILRAAYQDVKYGHIVSGASTITQQLVRANMLNDERTLNRKMQEVALAYEIGKRYSKRQILSLYLNSIPYGNLAYGAQAAAQVYFHLPVCRLDVAQAALLAGLPRAPSLYDPVNHRAAAMARLRTVLDLMYRHGYLGSRDEIAAALQEARGWSFAPLRAVMRYPQFVRYAISQVQNTPQLRDKLYQGIDIYTTLDPRLQDVAQRLVTKQIDGLTAQHVTDGALLSLDLRPQRYGWILSMVGSAHYRGQAGQINMAVSPRQPGSSMKPFNYIWAFTHGGVGPGTMVTDSAVRLPDPQDPEDGGWYEPQNYDHLWHGTITLRQALANSLNVPAVKLEFYITHPHNVAQTAARFGMSSLYRDNPGLDCQVCYAVTLGGLTRGTRLLEETSAYGVFATGGWTIPPTAIWKVVSRSTGRVLYCSEDCPRGVQPDRQLLQQRRQVLDAAHAYEMTNVLSDNNARCTPSVCEFGLSSPLLLSRPAAAKTGTTTSWTDNWTVGYTPQIVTGVWAGNADRSPMVNVIGVTGAAPIWHDFMESAFRILRLPVAQFNRPSSVITSSRCLQPGSTAVGFGLPDLYVPGPGVPAAPLCGLPDRGYMPVQCSQSYTSGYGSPPQLICNFNGSGTPTRYPYYGTQPYGTQQYTQPYVPQPNTRPIPQPPRSSVQAPPGQPHAPSAQQPPAQPPANPPPIFNPVPTSAPPPVAAPTSAPPPAAPPDGNPTPASGPPPPPPAGVPTAPPPGSPG